MARAQPRISFDELATTLRRRRNDRRSTMRVYVYVTIATGIAGFILVPDSRLRGQAAPPAAILSLARSNLHRELLDPTTVKVFNYPRLNLAEIRLGKTGD